MVREARDVALRLARSLTFASTTEDYRELARRRLPPFLFHYVDGAAGDESTASANLTDLRALPLRQRVMADVGSVSTRTILFGQDLAMPALLGPVGLAGLLWRRGEVQACHAAQASGVPFCLSTLGVCSLEEVATSVAEPPWFQLYMIRDRTFMADLLARTRLAGVRVLMLTVDVPVSGIRHRERRFGLTAGWFEQARQAATRPAWVWDVALRGRPLIFGTVAPAVSGARSLRDFWQWLANNFDPTVTWADLEFIRGHWDGPIVVKGIQGADDARAALQAGAQGIVVSNHGGRQLDGARSSIAVLPQVVQEVGGTVPVLFDGGVRSGTDVVRALASGASACLLGRAWAFALAAGGKMGIEQMLADLRAQIANSMALVGCRQVSEIGPGVLDRPAGA